MNAWKVGAGAGAILLGIYSALGFQDSSVMVIAGIILIAIGLGLIASG